MQLVPCACRVLYFAVAVRRPLARFLRFALMVPVFAALFGPASQGVHGLYVTLLRVRHVGCVRVPWPYPRSLIAALTNDHAPLIWHRGPSYSAQTRSNTDRGHRAGAQVLGCVAMFFLADMLKAVFAKLLSSRFHKENNFKKMAAALTNVSIPHRCCGLLTCSHECNVGRHACWAPIVTGNPSTCSRTSLVMSNLTLVPR